MLEILQAVPFSFGALFPVVNPIGSSVIFLSLVNGSSKAELNSLATKISIYTTIMLIIVLLVGSYILKLFGITIPIVLIGGGLVIAYLGWQLLNQNDTSSDKDISSPVNKNVEDMAFYPLTLPVTAGPGCIAIAIAIGAHGVSSNWHVTLFNQIGNAIGIVLIGILIFFCYRYAFTLTSKLSTSGTRVIMRLAAFINLCIGLQMIWHGVEQLIKAL